MPIKLGMVSFSKMLRVIAGLTVVSAIAATDRDPAPEPWRKAYSELHVEVTKLGEKIERHYYPEFLMIKGSDVVASVSIDGFGAKVLKEADEIFQTYREGLMACTDSHRTEYRPARAYSFERFAWFLDDYVTLVVSTIGEREEPKAVEGVREKRVATDRALYAYTQLGLSYLREKMARQKAKGLEDSAEKKMEAAFADIGRRVFRLDLTQKFDYRELVEKGAQSQPVFRNLATDESKAQLEAGLEPLATLLSNGAEEPSCSVSLTTDKP